MASRKNSTPRSNGQKRTGAERSKEKKQIRKHTEKY